jgi:acetoin utilization deacetylase AcuC-like enzyme
MRTWFSEQYCQTGVAFDTFRKAAAIAASLIDDPIGGVELVVPRPVGRGELEAVHTPAYVDAVLTGSPIDLASTNQLGWDRGLAKAVCASTGGVVAAAIHALATGSVAGSLSSGLHHAAPERGNGYCTVNGLAVAAQMVIRAGAARVLILDLDAHCGGGTAAILIRLARGVRPCIEQVDVSVDEFDRYESRPDARLTITDGPSYLEVIARELDRIDRPESIDLVLYNAGMDPHHLAGGVPGIDEQVLAERERIVFGWARLHRLPVAWVLAGGYVHGVETAPGVTGTDLAGLVRLHRLTIQAAAAAP